MKIFFDHCLSFTLAHALSSLFRDDHEIVALQDKFARDITDIEWIRALNQEGHWIVISGDLRITRNHAERRAFQSSQLTGFFMAPCQRRRKFATSRSAETPARNVTRPIAMFLYS